MDQIDIATLPQVLSPERFGRYLKWADGDNHRAVALYTMNCQISESLYTTLHMLEIALRNRIHIVASDLPIGDQGVPWFERAEFQRGSEYKLLSKAKSDLCRKGKPCEPERIVAALTFAYWTGLLGKHNENLWQRGLHRIAHRADGKGLTRKTFSEPLDQIRRLRNRIAHYEPIIHLDLPKRHDEIMQLTGWLSRPAAAWCRRHCRFSSVYPAQGIALGESDEQARP